MASMHTFLGVLCLMAALAMATKENCPNAPSAALRTVCLKLHRWDDLVRNNPTAKTPTVNIKSMKKIQPAMRIVTQLPNDVTARPVSPKMLETKMASKNSAMQPMSAKSAKPSAQQSNQANSANNANNANNAKARGPYECMDLCCLCPFLYGNCTGPDTCILPNGQKLQKAYRKEYRTMTDDERNRFHWAVRQAKESGDYDDLASLHSYYAVNGAAHAGAAFLPWHREFTKRYEFLLRSFDANISMPYWDSVLDSNLANPRESILWSEELMGASDSSGQVRNGFIADWPTQNGPNVVRHVGDSGELFIEPHIQYVLNQTAVNKVLAYSAPRQGCPVQEDFYAFESTHGLVHDYVGGDMAEPRTAADDPIFFLHHSFVDSVWEQWRQTKQSRSDRETAYPADIVECESELHFKLATMRPFDPKKNVDGLSNQYTDNLYTYAPRPTCTATTECGSRFLFCNRSHGSPQCSSKILPGGNCNGYTQGENPCYNGTCQNGNCVAQSS